MRFDLLTLFPDMFDAFLSTSIPGRAAACSAAEYMVHDLRRWADNPSRKVDDRPFGGGPGMVLMCQPVHDAVIAIEQEDSRPATRVLLTPQGERLDQERVQWFSQQERLLLISGHYEGIDERVIEELDPLQVSVGDYVLSSGETASMVLIDAITRLLKGVLGHEQSAEEDSFRLDEQTGQLLLDCPHYTRPREWKGREVPEVLLSGDHQSIARWRLEQGRKRTQQRRPDLTNQRPLGE